LGDQIKEDEAGRACGTYVVMRNMVEKLKEKGLLGRPRHGWDDIELDLKETGWEGM
jgi:hypothetical protein